MAQGKRFYKKNNRQAGAPGENQEATVAGSDNTPKGRIPADSSDKTAGGNPNQKDGRNQKAGNFKKRPGGKPFRKFNGKPDGKPGERNGENRGKRPGGWMRERQKPKTSGKVLVAYFSWSGVTEKAAQRIAAVVKGNSYRILPVNAYPSIYALCVAKGGMEKASGARPDIKGTIPDSSRYDKIAIGFPIWWFSCPMIIHSFLEKMKLAGKTVYPFCTSKTSGPKSSSSDIQKRIPDAAVKECLDANKIDSMTDEDIKKWLEI